MVPGSSRYRSRPLTRAAQFRVFGILSYLTSHFFDCLKPGFGCGISTDSLLTDERVPQAGPKSLSRGIITRGRRLCTVCHEKFITISRRVWKIAKNCNLSSFDPVRGCKFLQ